MVDHFKDTIIPFKERLKRRDRKIRALYRNGHGFSMDEIVSIMKRNGEGVSKTTVFFAINHKYNTTKKHKYRQKIRKQIKKHNNK